VREWDSIRWNEDQSVQGRTHATDKTEPQVESFRRMVNEQTCPTKVGGQWTA
jgi:hypothetical protein